MKIPYSKIHMALFNLDYAVQTTRKYSEEDRSYVVDTDDLKEPLNELNKLVNEGGDQK